MNNKLGFCTRMLLAALSHTCNYKTDVASSQLLIRADLFLQQFNNPKAKN